MSPWTIAHQALLSMGFPRQEYWRGLPFPSPEDIPDPGIKPVSPVSPALAGRFFTTAPPEVHQFSSGQSLSRVRLFVTPWTAVHQAPLSMGFSRQYTGVDCHFLLQGIFPTQGLNPGLLHCRQTLNRLSHQGSPWT